MEQSNPHTPVAAEEWLPIPGFPGYEVSSLGRVYSTKRGRVRELRGGLMGGGYRAVTLCADGHRLGRKVHRLVADAFHGPCPDGMEVRHLDGDKANNAAANLRYGTRSENMHDQVEHGAHANARKDHCPAGHEYTDQNTYVPPGRPRRCCRACDTERQARRRALLVERAA